MQESTSCRSFRALDFLRFIDSLCTPSSVCSFIHAHRQTLLSLCLSPQPIVHVMAIQIISTNVKSTPVTAITKINHVCVDSDEMRSVLSDIQTDYSVAEYVINEYCLPLASFIHNHIDQMNNTQLLVYSRVYSYVSLRSVLHS